jgi:hypothetical protein
MLIFMVIPQASVTVLDASGVSGTYKVSTVFSNVEPAALLSSDVLRN